MLSKCIYRRNRSFNHQPISTYSIDRGKGCKNFLLVTRKIFLYILRNSYCVALWCVITSLFRFLLRHKRSLFAFRTSWFSWAAIVPRAPNEATTIEPFVDRLQNHIIRRRRNVYFHCDVIMVVARWRQGLVYWLYYKLRVVIPTYFGTWDNFGTWKFKLSYFYALPVLYVYTDMALKLNLFPK